MKIKLNIRFGAYHWMGGFKLHHNPVHEQIVKCWYPPSIYQGEFRAKKGWKLIQVYRFFGLV